MGYFRNFLGRSFVYIEMADTETVALLSELIRRSGWPFEELLDHAEATPKWWAALAWGEAFKRLRWTKKLTQAEVAARAGFSQSFVSRFEKGRDVRMSELRRLYAALGHKALVIAELDGTKPRVDPRKEPSPLEEYLAERARQGRPL